MKRIGFGLNYIHFLTVRSQKNLMRIKNLLSTFLLMEDKEKGLIPIDKTKNITLSGDFELDNEVASILLDTVHTRLPNFHSRHKDDTKLFFN